MTTPRLPIEASFKIDRRQMPTFWVPPTIRIQVGQRGPYVVLFLDGRPIAMRTPQAHKEGFALVKTAGECLPNELVVLTINKSDIELPPGSARDIGGSLLLKADAADDFQLKHSMRTS